MNWREVDPVAFGRHVGERILLDHSPRRALREYSEQWDFVWRVLKIDQLTDDDIESLEYGRWHSDANISVCKTVGDFLES